MLSPHKRMSAFQSAQMYSLQDANIHNLAVRGVFDDCQDMVKKVNADAAYKAQHRIGAVNSINWARVAAQVVYYFKGYFAATRDDREQVSFAVPSGNFGNIYAGTIARRLGLPIRRLILASNENDVLDRFFKTGKYKVSKSVKQTTSPSMDISKASNFERFVFDLVGRDPARVKDLWRRLEGGDAAEGEFDLSHTAYWPRVAQSGIVSGKSTNHDRLATIRGVFQEYREMIDPHTADGLKVGLEYREAGVPLICLETALPAKFGDTIRSALGREPERPAEFQGLEGLPQRFTLIEPDAEAVKRYIASH
jgi:threonine synthase